MSRGALQHLRQIHQQQQNATQMQQQQQGWTQPLVDQIFHNDLKFTTDGQQNQTSHEPRSRAFYYSINSLSHTWNSYYTEPPMKVPITLHHQKYRYYATPSIIIALGSFSPPSPPTQPTFLTVCVETNPNAHATNKRRRSQSRTPQKQRDKDSGPPLHQKPSRHSHHRTSPPLWTHTLLRHKIRMGFAYYSGTLQQGQRRKPHARNQRWDTPSHQEECLCHFGENPPPN